MDRIAALTDLLAQDPNNALARYGLAMEYSNSGDFNHALEEFGKLLATNPDYVPGYHMCAQTLVKAGRAQEARTILETASSRPSVKATRTPNQRCLRCCKIWVESSGGTGITVLSSAHHPSRLNAPGRTAQVFTVSLSRGWPKQNGVRPAHVLPSSRLYPVFLCDLRANSAHSAVRIF